MRSRGMRLFAAVLMAVAVLPVSAGAQESIEFVDDDGSVHEANIEGLAAAGITKGCNPPANDRYCPDDPVSRAQMASFLVRALDLPAGPSGQFTDISGSVHEENINALGASGITRGCNPPANDQFCPGDSVTRAQMASFLVRALDLPAGPSGQFTDISGSVHEENINALGAAGITKGCNPPANDQYCPDDPVSRAQMASFLVRALDLTPGDTEPPPPDDPPDEPDPTVSGTLEVRFLDIIGDAALYIGQCGEVGMIDAGAGRAAEIAAALDQVGTRDLAWVIVSHYDSDAVGDVSDLALEEDVTYGAVYDRGGGADAHPSNSYTEDYYPWITDPENAGLRQQVQVGDQVTLCEGEEQVDFNVLAVNTQQGAGGKAVVDENDKSICLRIEFGNYDMASCGDLHGQDANDDADVESVIAPDVGDVEFARVNKHGSADSSNETWVTTLSAEAAVMTGSTEDFHPHPDVIGAWEAMGALYITSDPFEPPADGTVIVTTEGLETFSVTTSATGKNDTFPLDEAG